MNLTDPRDCSFIFRSMLERKLIAADAVTGLRADEKTCRPLQPDVAATATAAGGSSLRDSPLLYAVGQPLQGAKIATSGLIFVTLHANAAVTDLMQSLS